MNLRWWQSDIKAEKQNIRKNFTLQAYYTVSYEMHGVALFVRLQLIEFFIPVYS